MLVTIATALAALLGMAAAAWTTSRDRVCRPGAPRTRNLAAFAAITALLTVSLTAAGLPLIAAVPAAAATTMIVVNAAARTAWAVSNHRARTAR